ncbi:MAG: hypothetical protein A3G76_12895 [Acidobacteria bacterium RIFCSPLOWO2_12_FULL_65_11]|nr:MAG: hypothetical protein A3H95_07940 [Acidobacteria bacterium RIFCSPLOWO2_02_FULL_64_15]OFW29992.1 MAG: hypothetical protein A3G76_12895 [Acidobacteria bacterium RIFCSPLOWO2_12_FULL_65_11]
MRIKISALLFLASLVGGAVAPLFAQSLADVARREEERRKAVRTPAKVITNTDLKPVLPPESAPPPASPASTTTATTATTPDAAAAPGGAAATGAAPAAGAAGATGAAPVKDQAYWSGRLQGLQTQLARDQVFADAIQVKISALATDFVNRDNPVERAAIETERNKSLAELDRLRKAITDGQKSIADLQEEARQAGVPPGWLR